MVIMALRRDTARHLYRALHHETAFADAVGVELAAGRLKRKVGEKLIIDFHTNRQRVLTQIEHALRGT